MLLRPSDCSKRNAKQRAERIHVWIVDGGVETRKKKFGLTVNIVTGSGWE
jgi:hypothetical protein